MTRRWNESADSPSRRRIDFVTHLEDAEVVERGVLIPLASLFACAGSRLPALSPKPLVRGLPNLPEVVSHLVGEDLRRHPVHLEECPDQNCRCTAVTEVAGHLADL